MCSGFSFNLKLYDEPPSGFAHLMGLVDMAHERLKLYKVLYTKTNVDNIKTNLKDSPFLPLLSPENQPSVDEAARIDHVSHWALRIAFTKSNTSYFIQNELDWFKVRFNNMTDADKSHFMASNGFNYPPVSDDEKARFKLQPKTTWYKIRFTDVAELLKKRLYPLHHGFLYVPRHKVVFWFLEKLKIKLEMSLTHIKKMLPNNWSDQLETVVSLINLDDIPTVRLNCKHHISLCELEEATSRFPLCMKFQHETLRETHHLKYFSRMQYGLFLKGLGLSLDESLEFWGDEFANTMTEDQFNRKYSYLFKHQYGTVGSKIDYAPYSCEKIFEEPVLPKQVNGCPFKHWGERFLSIRLQDDGASQEAISDILQLKTERKYGEACRRYFKCFWECGDRERAVTHPNKYYEECCDIEDLLLDED